MPKNNACLGICFFGNQLFYAISNASLDPRLTRIGAVDFNFDIAEALTANRENHLEGLRGSVSELLKRYDAPHLRLLLYPSMECWATLPKLVYDDAGEREAYINILMDGGERKNTHPAWHTLSNENFKLLQLRSDHSMEGIQALTAGLPQVGYASAFEIGEIWIEHARPGGSFLTVTAFENCLSVSSFILGKLRGATFIEFDEPEDLPYLWLQKARDLAWMQGLHEQIQVYGHRAFRIIDILEPFWDEAATVTKMDTLDKMQVEADENTYGFDLALAYPAIMLALGSDA